MYIELWILNSITSHSPDITGKFSSLEVLKDEDYNIVWEWGKAVIIDSPEVWLVHKIPYEWGESVIMDEFQEHEKFILTMREGKRLWIVPDYIKIPSVRHMPEPWAAYFSQERVNGLNLKNIQIILRDPRMKWHDRVKMMQEYSDFELKEYFVTQILWDKDREEAEEDYDMDYVCWAKEIIWEFVEWEKKEAFMRTISFLESRWCIHHDLHNGNVMIDRTWNIYIIDFWQIKPYEDIAEESY